MINSNLRTTFGSVCLTLTLIVAGCGGGGGGGDTVQAATSSGTGGTTSTPSSGGTTNPPVTIAPLTITNTTPTNYQWADLSGGMAVYVDRNYTFVDVPAAAEGLRYLQTANDDKSLSSAAAIQFDVNQPVTVFVAYDDRATSLPLWLQTWTDTGMRLVTTDTDLDVYQKDFPAGTVSLGGNETGRSMYSVAVKSQGSSTTTSGPLTIGGTPSGSITENMSYSFVPTASGGSGTRTFSISNEPGWASFNTNTGAMTGTPGMASIGMTFSGIVISVTDGQSTESLPAFAVAVLASGNGSATLSWSSPTQNEDNSTLTDLAGFNIYYGTSAGNYPNSVRISNPGVTTGIVENLAPGTWSFVVTAYDLFGNESGFSNVAQKTIAAP